MNQKSTKAFRSPYFKKNNNEFWRLVTRFNAQNSIVKCSQDRKTMGDLIVSERPVQITFHSRLDIIVNENVASSKDANDGLTKSDGTFYEWMRFYNAESRDHTEFNDLSKCSIDSIAASQSTRRALYKPQLSFGRNKQMDEKQYKQWQELIITS